MDLNDLIRASPHAACEICFQLYPSITLMPLREDNKIIVCMRCALDAMDNNPFLNIVKKD